MSIVAQPDVAELIPDDELLQVLDFFRKFNFIRHGTPTHLTHRLLGERIDHMTEELTEFAEAAQAQDMAKMLDALIDLVYLAKGTALMMGLGPAWRTAFRDVQRANMSKERGTTHRGHSQDVIKPPGWEGPRTEAILSRFGYDRDRFQNYLGEVEDRFCDDVDRPR
jgi:predicted HAD superfamily Cof-like phosphohydrolase